MNKKILITGGDKSQRKELAEIIRIGSEQKGITTTVFNFEDHDVLTGMQIPKSIQMAVFVAEHEEKKFAGIYTRLIKSSDDKLSFVHIDLN